MELSEFKTRSAYDQNPCPFCSHTLTLYYHFLEEKMDCWFLGSEGFDRDCAFPFLYSWITAPSTKPSVWHDDCDLHRALLVIPLPSSEVQKLSSWPSAQLQLGVRSLLTPITVSTENYQSRLVFSPSLDVIRYHFLCILWLFPGKLLNVVISLVHSRTRTQ